MVMQYSTVLRNARLNVIETTIGVSPTLKLRTGPPPASPQAAKTGSVVATLPLPADWMGDAAGGVKQKSGVWEDPTADADGTIGHFQIEDGAGNVHIQGTVTQTGAGGDMTVDNTLVKAGQDILINTFSITGSNA